MEKIILPLLGKANYGKTSTIKEIYKQFCKKHNVKGVNLNKRLRVEILAKVTVNGKVIGFSSNGDNEESIKKEFGIMIQEKCDIIVCAIRDNKDGKTHTLKKLVEEIARQNNYKFEEPFIYIEKRNGSIADDNAYAIKQDKVDIFIKKLDELVK